MLSVRLSAVLVAVLGPMRGVWPQERPPARTPEDLVLVATRDGDGVLRPGPVPQVRLRLENRSRTATHPVILPGDGSADGRREPWVHWTAVVQPTGGEARVLEREPSTRIPCKQFDRDWRRSVVLLAPGESVELGDWVPLIGQDYVVQEAGTVQLTAHYVYRRRGVFDTPSSREDFGRMGDVPPFTLVSAPVEFRVVRPLDVVVRDIRPAKVGENVRLGNVLDVQVVNRSEAIQELQSGWNTRFEVAEEARVGWLAPIGCGPQPKDVIRLDPGGVATIAGDRVGTVGFRESGTFMKPGEVQVRVSLNVDGMLVRSAWTTLRVVE